MATRSTDFRYLAADAFSLNISDNNVKVVLGIEEQPGEIIDVAGVVMTHKTLKMFSIVALDALARLEKAMGQEITVDEEKIKRILAQREEAKESSANDGEQQP